MNCDVVVLGAGPAGLATAIGCAEAGLDVRILDRSGFPRSSVGEAVHPGAEALFHRLGVSDTVRKAGFVRHNGIWVERNNHREFVPFGETAGHSWRGFQLWRPSFDQILLDRAKELGSEFIAPCVALDALPTRRGVRVLTGAGTFDAKTIVDGSGRNRWLARHWGFKIRAFSPTLVARYEYAEGSCHDLDDNPIFITGRDGWEWTARVRKNLYQRISLRYVQSKEAPSKTPGDFELLRKVGRSRGADVTWTLVGRSAGFRHFLVGDAAAVLDPSSSHGILRALTSGILATNCILKIISNDKSCGNAAVAGYTAWQWNWFLQDVKRLRAFRHANLNSRLFLAPEDNRISWS